MAIPTPFQLKAGCCDRICMFSSPSLREIEDLVGLYMVGCWGRFVDSVFIDMRPLPTSRFLAVWIDESGVYAEAWAEGEADRRALREFCEGISQGSEVLVEARHEGLCPSHFCGTGRIAWLRVYEKELLRPGNIVLVAHVSLKR